MNRLFRSNSSVSSKSTRIPEIPEVVNEEHVEYHDEDSFIDVNDWNIPKVPGKEIYRKKWSMTSFKTEQHVKTVEQVYALNKEHELCQLFSPNAIKRHRREGYNFIHIGLVQVAIKPLTRRGLKASVMLRLRDARFPDWQDSLLGVIEATMHDRPVYFDCYPDFTVSLIDPHILKVLTLSIRSQGYRILEGVQPLALIYRIYYKCTRTNMNFQAINRSPRNQTMLIQSSQSNASIHIPRTINWIDIELPKEWMVTNESFKPEIISHNLGDLDYIQQYLDGTVKISFERGPQSTPKPNLIIEEVARSSASRSGVPRSRSSRQPKDKTPARHLFAGSTSTEELRWRDLELEKELRNLKLKGVQTTSQVSHPCYTADTQLEDEES
jgi:hypothetical protein